MPWKNQYRQERDYSHLLGVTLDTVLDAAIQRRGYGGDRKTYPAEANVAILRLFRTADWISRGNLRLGADTVRAARGWSAEFALDVIGNTVGWGLHLGLIEEAPGPDGERGYRLLEREQVYEVVAGKAVRVIGLPPDEQIAMNLRRSKLRRLQATLARKRAAKIRMFAAPAIDRLIAANPLGRIPETLHPFLGDFLVNLSGDVTLCEVRELLVDAHTDWDRRIQSRWVVALDAAVAAAETEAAANREREAAEVISQEDIDAFAGI